MGGWVVGILESNAKLNSKLRLKLKLKLELSLATIQDQDNPTKQVLSFEKLLNEKLDIIFPQKFLRFQTFCVSGRLKEHHCTQAWCYQKDLIVVCNETS